MPNSLRHLAASALLLASCVASGLTAESALPRNVYAELNPPAVPGVSVHNVQATTADLEWPASLSSAGSFRCEVLRFSLDSDRELKIEWEKFPSVAIARHGEVYRARLTGLTAQQPYWIRVLPESSGAASGEAIFAVRFQTPAVTPVFTWRRAIIAGLLLALGGLVWLRWQRGRA